MRQKLTLLKLAVVNTIGLYTVDLSASYLDTVKDRAYSDPMNSLSRRSAQTVLYYLLMNYLSMISPIVPLLAEELWVFTPENLKKEVVSPIMLGWYQPKEQWNNKELVEEFWHLDIIGSAVKKNIEKAKIEE